MIISELHWYWMFYWLQNFASKKIQRMGTGKTTFNFHGIFHIDAGKNNSASEQRSFELFLLFTFPGSIIRSGRPVM